MSATYITVWTASSATGTSRVGPYTPGSVASSSARAGSLRWGEQDDRARLLLNDLARRRARRRRAHRRPAPGAAPRRRELGGLERVPGDQSEVGERVELTGRARPAAGAAAARPRLAPRRGPPPGEAGGCGRSLDPPRTSRRATATRSPTAPARRSTSSRSTPAMPCAEKRASASRAAARTSASRSSKNGAVRRSASRLRHTSKMVDAAAFFFAWWRLLLGLGVHRPRGLDREPGLHEAHAERVPRLRSLVGEHHRHDAVVAEDAMALGEDRRHLRLVVGVGELLPAACPTSAKRAHVRDRLVLLVGELGRRTRPGGRDRACASPRRRRSRTARRTSRCRSRADRCRRAAWNQPPLARSAAFPRVTVTCPVEPDSLKRSATSVGQQQTPQSSSYASSNCSRHQG